MTGRGLEASPPRSSGLTRGPRPAEPPHGPPDQVRRPSGWVRSPNLATRHPGLTHPLFPGEGRDPEIMKRCVTGSGPPSSRRKRRGYISTRHPGHDPGSGAGISAIRTERFRQIPARCASGMTERRARRGAGGSLSHHRRARSRRSPPPPAASLLPGRSSDH